MSLLKSNSVQIGQSTTGTNNFTLSVPASPDGTIKLARGNSGATTADVLTVDASGNVTTTLADGSVKFSQLSTSATEADNVAKRTAKAWVNFNGTTNTAGNCTIRSDFNVSTVADNGSGDYTVTFSTALANADYATQVTGSTPSGAVPGTTGYVGFLNTSTSPSTTAISILFHHPGVGNRDSEYANISVFST